MASVPDDGEKQGISVAAVRYMASVGNGGCFGDVCVFPSCFFIGVSM
jgi:hypothetical protein